MDLVFSMVCSMKKEIMFNSFRLTISEKSGFVGIRENLEEIELCLPHGFNLPSDEKRMNYRIRKLLLCIEKARISTRINFSIKEDFISTLPFSSYDWLIRDYIENNFFVQSEKISSTSGSGKINWKRTISGNPVFLDDRIYYNELYKSSKLVFEDDFTYAHKACISISTRMLGWLYDGMIYTFDFSIERLKGISRNLRSIYSQYHDDRSKLLIRHLIKVIDSNTGASTLGGGKVFGTTKFEYVWEQMVFEAFNNVDKRNYNPTSSWNVLGERINNSSLVIDSIYSSINTTYIIDAKYYRFDVLFPQKYPLPGTTDIQKQITYAESYLSKHPNTIVKNCFLIPFSAEDSNCHDFFKCIGFSKNSWREENLEYAKVHLLLVDMNYLLDKYENSKDSLRFMLESVFEG